MLSSLSIAAKLTIGSLLMALAVAAGCLVTSWHKDAEAYSALKPQFDSLVTSNVQQGEQLAATTVENGRLKLSISDQNHAVELAQQKAQAAEDLQAQAKVANDRLSAQKDARLAVLQKDLEDTSKTLHDVLKTAWDQEQGDAQ